MKTLISFLTSKTFWLNLLYIFIAFCVLTFIAFQVLKFYTNHGEKLRMPDYLGKKIEMAREDAEDRSFQIEIQDSIFIVDKPGNIILNQNPKPDAYVKEGRKIYVTITKSEAETVAVSDLPRLYGENFDIKSQELKIGYEIESEIVGRQYDPGPENHILSVVYKGDTIISGTSRDKEMEIEKGGTLGFILSESKGGLVPLPDLVCRTYGEARFLLSTFNISLKAQNDITGSPEDHFYIVSQDPPYDPSQNIRMGNTVTVTVAEEKPIECSDSYE